MSSLILLRHSLPQVIEGQPANSWKLSTEGLARCLPLAEQLRPLQPDLFFASNEPKALETSAITAAILSKQSQVIDGLHEHERSDVPWMGQDRFEQTVADFFARPGELVFGDETADQAYDRFSAAVNALIAQQPDKTLVVASGGTVISLFIARATGADPFPLWQSLMMPWFAALSLPAFELLGSFP